MTLENLENKNQHSICKEEEEFKFFHLQVDLPTSLHIQCQDSRPPKINSNSPLFHTIRLSLSDCSLDCTSLTGPCSSILNLVPALTSLSINNIDSLPASVCR